MHGFSRTLFHVGSFVPGLAIFLSACGAGTAAIVAGASGDDGGGTTPGLNSFITRHVEVSPAELVLNANLAMRVRLFYDTGGGQQPMNHIGGANVVGGNEVSLPREEDVTVQWFFDQDLGTTTALQKNVRLLARISGGSPIVGGEIIRDIGNDPPEIVVDTDGFAIGSVPLNEVAGRALVTFVVRDSSRDQVSLEFEYAIVDDLDLDAGELPADEDFLPATPEGPAPPFTADDAGTTAVFTWNVPADLPISEHDVVLRITPTDLDDAGDPIFVGTPRLTRGFRIDNNVAPTVQLLSRASTDPDERRGIPIPYQVLDLEGDPVEVILQWRLEGESFPDLPTDDAGAIDAILADPLQRRKKQICSPYSSFAQGRLVPVDAVSARLPELASGESWILARGIEGRSLEILRPPSVPERLAASWSVNDLVRPVAAVLLGDGRTALVLDEPGGIWRLREIELATGRSIPATDSVIAQGSGPPTAICLERGAKAALVASGGAGAWRIERVELASGAVSQLLAADGSEPGPVRGIASLGNRSLIFSAGSSLYGCDYRDLSDPHLGTLLTGLANPWGLDVDPLPPHRVYVSERAANRILAVELDGHGALPVVVRTAELQVSMLESPSVLALERQGARVIVVTSPPSGGHALMGIDLGATGRNVSYQIGEPWVNEIAGLASGSDGLRLLTLAVEHELLVAGGLEARHDIVAFDPQGQLVVVDPPFATAPVPGRLWRIREENRRLATASQGETRSFLWDSREVNGKSAFLRAIARDSEFGVEAESKDRMILRSPLDVEPLELGGFSRNGPASLLALDLDTDGDRDLLSAGGRAWFQRSPGHFESGTTGLSSGGVSCASADFDGDGDADLVSAHFGQDNLTVSLQVTPGTFVETFVLGDAATTHGPRSVAAADLDGDGDMDVVSANELGDDLTVFYRDSTSFVPHVLGGISVTDTPVAIATADLDGDGDLDLVSANADGHELTIFFQAGGSFADQPLHVGGLSTTRGPRSVIAADLDGDGDQDLVSANRDGNDLTVFPQISPGAFAADPWVLGGFPVTNGPRSVAAGDLDGDGDMDLVSANEFGDDLTVFFQLAPGSFPDAPLTLGGSGTTNDDASVVAEDVDGDGDLDLVSSGPGVFLQEGPGVFDGPALALGNGSPAMDGPFALDAADLDGDGDLDVVSANRDGHDLTFLLQLSPGEFASAVAVGGSPTTNAPSSIVAADLDGDGDQDIVSANELGNDLTVFLQQPSGFEADPLVLGGFPTISRPGTVAAGDLDDDGDLDLVSANELFGNNLTVFSQDGVGVFDPKPHVIGDVSTSNLPGSLALADIDGDGHVDLVTANEFGNNLTVFRADGQGSYAPHLIGGSSTTRAPLSVAAADLDGDGNEDLVSANGEAHTLTVFFQLSTGDFGSSPVVLGGFPTTRRPESIVSGDLDGDGDLDLASGNHFGNNITIFSQLTPRAFEPVPLVLGGFPTTSRPAALLTIDLDGDGDRDLLSANANGDDLTVFWGGH